MTPEMSAIVLASIVAIPSTLSAIASFRNGKKTDALKADVNSKSEKQAEEWKSQLDALRAELASVRKILADKTGTVEDRVRADMAEASAEKSRATTAPQLIAAPQK